MKDVLLVKGRERRFQTLPSATFPNVIRALGSDMELWPATIGNPFFSSLLLFHLCKTVGLYHPLSDAIPLDALEKSRSRLPSSVFANSTPASLNQQVEFCCRNLLSNSRNLMEHEDVNKMKKSLGQWLRFGAVDWPRRPEVQEISFVHFQLCLTLLSGFFKLKNSKAHLTPSSS